MSGAHAARGGAGPDRDGAWPGWRHSQRMSRAAAKFAVTEYRMTRDAHEPGQLAHEPGSCRAWACAGLAHVPGWACAGLAAEGGLPGLGPYRDRSAPKQNQLGGGVITSV